MTNNGGGLSGFWRRVWTNPTLEWGCEISPEGVCLTRWETGSRGLGTAAWRPLPSGAMEVSPLRENLLQPELVRQALSGCLESLGRSNGMQSAGRPVDTALVIPDQAARVFFITFDEFPRQHAQAVPLIRWKLKKSVPFDIDISTVSYVAQRQGSEWHILAVVSPEVIVHQYESIAQELGLKPRFVTLSTIGSLGLVPSSDNGDVAGGSEPVASSFLVAKFSPPWLTTAILYEGSVRLFRTVPIATGPTGELASELTQSSLGEILEAIHPSVAYFQDNFGRPLERAYLCGLGEITQTVADSLSNELNLPTRALLQESAPSVPGWDHQESERHMSALMGIARARRRG